MFFGQVCCHCADTQRSCLDRLLQADDSVLLIMYFQSYLMLTLVSLLGVENITAVLLYYFDLT